VQKELAAANKKLDTYEKDKVEKPKKQGMAETQYEHSRFAVVPFRIFLTLLTAT
jgi:hypothetical protein